MTDRFASRSYRFGSLPDWHPWVSRFSGVLCYGAAVFAGIAVWRDFSLIGIVVFGVSIVMGSLLLVLPEYFRYYAALRMTPPLPDRIEEAFDEVFENLREFRDALERVGEMARQPTSKAGETFGREREDEFEEALSRLKLDFEDFAEQLRPLLPNERDDAERRLPSGLLAKALSGAGKGKGFPFKDAKEDS
ncbi:MAG: hypothetical protein AAGJ81_12975 [Verrucomicrobiota bacterium]